MIQTNETVLAVGKIDISCRKASTDSRAHIGPAGDRGLNTIACFGIWACGLAMLFTVTDLRSQRLQLRVHSYWLSLHTAEVFIVANR